VRYGPLVACYEGEGVACSRAEKRKGHEDLAELMGQCRRFVSTVLKRLHVGVVTCQTIVAGNSFQSMTWKSTDVLGF
jgi:hypothetical protein